MIPIKETDARLKPCIGPCPSNTGVSNEGTIYYCRGESCMAWEHWKEERKNGELVRYGVCSYTK